MHAQDSPPPPPPPSASDSPSSAGSGPSAAGGPGAALAEKADAPWLRRLPLCSPTLPPATHTNVYLVGERELLIVDPGTPYEEELAHLIEQLGALRDAGHRPAGIFLTHHHYDHASGALALQRALGLPVLAHAVTAERLVEQLGLRVDRPVADGEVLGFGPRGLRAVHTPGHAPGHLCLHDLAGGGVLAGDMVASVGTIIVDPGDGGDMRLYLASLRRLLELDPLRDGPLRLWPAHGSPVEDGPAHLAYYIRHRELRETKVLASLAHGPLPLDRLVPLAYDDVPPAVHPLARVSLLAHLRKLQDEGRARLDDSGAWSLR